MIDTVALELKIIELAMKGKLTHQNTYEHADSFYDEIVLLRNRFQIEGKIAKTKTIEDIKEDEIMFSIPDNWKWVRINEVLDVVMGQSPQGTSVSGDTDGMEFHQGKIYFTDKYLNDSMQRTCEITKIAKANSILLCVRAPVGVVNIVDREVCIGRGLCAISSYSDIDPLFVFYFLKICKKRFEMQGAGSTFSAITVDTVKKQLIPLPPKEEMKRIVDLLEEAFALTKKINKAQKLYISDLEVLKSKIIDAGIQGKLTEQLSEDGTAEELYTLIQKEKKQILQVRKGREDKNIKEVDIDVPYELPASWKWVRFGEIGLFKKGPFGSALTKAIFVPKSDDTVKIYEQQHAIQKNSELGTYYITREYFDDKMSGFEVLPGDILVSCAGTIGETYILPDEIEQGIINQALMRVSLVPSVNKKFFQYFFDANLKKTAQEESNGSAIKNIPPFDVMKNWYFPLPPIAEQLRIVDRIDELLSLI